MNKYFRTNYFTVINRKYTRVLYMYAVPIHVCSTYSTYSTYMYKYKNKYKYKYQYLHGNYIMTITWSHGPAAY